MPARTSSRGDVGLQVGEAEHEVGLERDDARRSCALVNAETRGFSRRARGGRTVKPEMPTMRQSSPSRYSVSVVSSVRQTMRCGNPLDSAGHVPTPRLRRRRTGILKPCGLRIWAFLDWCFFGPASVRAGYLGLSLRVLRYPYAVMRDLSRGEINLRAMGLVYTTLLSLIPLLAFSFAILKVFGAHRDLEPIVYEFFRPVGEQAAQELTARVMQFADRVSSGVVGSVGLALLAWTLIGTIKKVEDSFNFLWRVEQPRSFARRIAEYPRC